MPFVYFEQDITPSPFMFLYADGSFIETVPTGSVWEFECRKYVNMIKTKFIFRFIVLGPEKKNLRKRINVMMFAGNQSFEKTIFANNRNFGQGFSSLHRLDV